MQPYFSIILSIYNVEAYLERCVRSVLSQSFTDYELILVDDGATDSSPAMCDAFASQDSRIRVIHKENGGLSSARNAGLKEATGQYIWWVDADDWILPEALEHLYAQTAYKPNMVKFAHYRVINGTMEPVRAELVPDLYGDRELLLDQACFTPGKFGLSAWSYVYSRRFLQEYGLQYVSERQVGSEDYLFNLQALMQVSTVSVTDQPLYAYELRSGSLSQTYKPDLAERYCRLYEILETAETDRRTRGRLAAFYLWHLVHGTCMSGEYHESSTHSMETGRKNVRKLLRSAAVRRAFSRCAWYGFTPKQKLQLCAMALGFEPLFYRLFVKKGGCQ